MMEQQTQQLKNKKLFVTFLDPDNFEPHLTCLTAAELNESLDAQGLKRALLNLLKIITSRAY